MKQCPICNSMAFDDATTCFGCLHPFLPEGQTAEPDRRLPFGRHGSKAKHGPKTSRAETKQSVCEDTARKVGEALQLQCDANRGIALTQGKPTVFLLTITPWLNGGGNAGDWTCEVMPMQGVHHELAS